MEARVRIKKEHKMTDRALYESTDDGTSATFSFVYVVGPDGKYADIKLEGGKLIFDGDLEIDTAARLFFERTVAKLAEEKNIQGMRLLADALELLS